MAVLFRIRNSHTLCSCILGQCCHRWGQHPEGHKHWSRPTLAKPGGLPRAHQQGHWLSKGSSKPQCAVVAHGAPRASLQRRRVLSGPWEPSRPCRPCLRTTSPALRGTPPRFSREPRLNTSLTWRLFTDLLPVILSGDRRSVERVTCHWIVFVRACPPQTQGWGPWGTQRQVRVWAGGLAFHETSSQICFNLVPYAFIVHLEKMKLKQTSRIQSPGVNRQGGQAPSAQPFGVRLPGFRGLPTARAFRGPGSTFFCPRVPPTPVSSPGSGGVLLGALLPSALHPPGLGRVRDPWSPRAGLSFPHSRKRPAQLRHSMGGRGRISVPNCHPHNQRSLNRKRFQLVFTSRSWSCQLRPEAPCPSGGYGCFPPPPVVLSRRWEVAAGAPVTT